MEVVTQVSAIRRYSLPLFLTRPRKYAAGVALFGYAIVLYLLSNHYPLFPPQMLVRTPLDVAVPFLPNTVWLYMSEWLFFTAIYVVSEDMDNLNKYIYSFFTLPTVSCLIFWAFPTTYPRELFPLPADLNSLTYFAFNHLRHTDTPANCCPSLHVSGVYLSALIYLDEQRKYFPVFLLWATASAFSTLTTKQHYFIDVVCGFLLAIVIYGVFHRWASYRKVV
jgi:membrane-associated phospholipid phosphatase